MSLYLDTSALVKLYVQEDGSEEVGAAVSAATDLATSVLAGVEVAAALAKAARIGSLARAGAREALDAFWRDWPDLPHIEPSEGLTRRAASLAWEHDLRGYDAVHLASALWLRETLGSTVVLMTYDRHLWTAASREGLGVAPSTL